MNDYDDTKPNPPYTTMRDIDEQARAAIIGDRKRMNEAIRAATATTTMSDVVKKSIADAARQREEWVKQATTAVNRLEIAKFDLPTAAVAKLDLSNVVLPFKPSAVMLPPPTQPTPAPPVAPTDDGEIVVVLKTLVGLAKSNNDLFVKLTDAIVENAREAEARADERFRLSESAARDRFRKGHNIAKWVLTLTLAIPVGAWWLELVAR